MQISSRFTIAIHILTCIETFGGQQKVTGDFLAASVNVNPVVIRRLLQQLKAAGLVAVQRGSGGASVARPLDQITFLDVYRAVDCVEKEGLFHFHEAPNQDCPVGRNIHAALDGRLMQVQRAMEREMASITVADVVRDTQRCIAAETQAAERAEQTEQK